MKSRYLFLFGAALCSLFAAPNPVLAQGTAFTYNGVLNHNGTQVNGAYDLRFTLYDAAAAGNVIAGPMPANAVGVTNGLFATRIDFGVGVFTGPPRWLGVEIQPTGGGGFVPLTPRQEMTSSPYAIRAASAGTAADVSAGSVVKSLNNLHDGLTLAAGANVTITPNGNTLTLAAAGAGGSGIWSVLNNNAYYLAGNVGIGTNSPAPGVRLEVDGTTRVSPGGSGGFVSIGTPNGETGIGIIGANRADIRFDGLTLKLLAGLGATAPANGIAVNTLGSVGIGTFSPTPGVALEVNGTTRITPGGSGGFVAFGPSSGETGMSIIGTNRADLRFDGSTLKLLAGLGTTPPADGIAINTSGNVGIGTTAPVAKLHAETSQANLAAVYGNATGVGGVGVYGQSALGAAVHAEGNAVQARDKGGFVKAMLFVNQDGTIARCYNGITDSSTGNCGFTVTHLEAGSYDVNLNFKVDDRFVSITPRQPLDIHSGVSASFRFEVGFPNEVFVDTFITNLDTNGNDTPFMLIVY